MCFSRSLTLAALTIGFANIAAPAAIAEFVQWRIEDGGNGHWYDAISRPEGQPRISWPQANALAEASGEVWHLATITSAEENAFVFGLIDDPIYWNAPTHNYHGPFLGGFSSNDWSNDWQWVTGEPWGYTNWTLLYPCSNGTYLHFYSHMEHTPKDTWNDLIYGFFADGYVIESSAASPSALQPSWVVPEPSTFILAVFGLLCIGCSRRRKRA